MSHNKPLIPQSAKDGVAGVTAVVTVTVFVSVLFCALDYLYRCDRLVEMARCMGTISLVLIFGSALWLSSSAFIEILLDRDELEHAPKRSKR